MDRTSVVDPKLKRRIPPQEIERTVPGMFGNEFIRSWEQWSVDAECEQFEVITFYSEEAPKKRTLVVYSNPCHECGEPNYAPTPATSEDICQFCQGPIAQPDFLNRFFEPLQAICFMSKMLSAIRLLEFHFFTKRVLFGKTGVPDSVGELMLEKLTGIFRIEEIPYTQDGEQLYCVSAQREFVTATLERKCEGRSCEGLRISDQDSVFPSKKDYASGDALLS